MGPRPIATFAGIDDAKFSKYHQCPDGAFRGQAFVQPQCQVYLFYSKGDHQNVATLFANLTMSNALAAGKNYKVD